MISESTDLARVFRAESGRILAILLTQFRDFDLAEDALQDACLLASQKWPEKGLPNNQAAWLLTVARRRLIDKLRRSSYVDKEEVIQAIHRSLTRDHKDCESDQFIPDERLKLIFTCCHPALPETARVALTLNTLCGLSAVEIARSFLVSEATLRQRLTRAKRKIRQAGIAYRVPEEEAIKERLPSVLAVIYLIFNESYSAYEGQSITRKDLADEAIRLARVLHKLLPQPEVEGLLALLLLHSARANARSSDTHAFIPLEHQDRKRWNQDAISEGRTLLLAALAKAQPGKYQIQGAISALHAEAQNWQQTDWLQIQLLYQELYKIEESPVIELNRLVAVAHGGNLMSAMEGINFLQKDLINYQPFYAARADIATKMEDYEQAGKDYKQAIAMSKNNPERDFLISRYDALSNIVSDVSKDRRC